MHILSTTDRGSLHEADRLWIYKLCLRGFSLVVSLTATILLAVTLQFYNTNLYGHDGLHGLRLTDMWPLIAVLRPAPSFVLYLFSSCLTVVHATSILANIPIILSTIFAAHSLHPTVLVAIDVIAWAGLGFSCGYAVTDTTSNSIERGQLFDARLLGKVRRASSWERAGAGVGLVACGLHFALFALSVVNVHKRHMEKALADHHRHFEMLRRESPHMSYHMSTSHQHRYPTSAPIASPHPAAVPTGTS
ncbi:MAG: hypothetical protein M1833_006333 [Piccolia ochrophora]|nr:MAG: hypothetical protein M1833_006333 [Piccolia ochrophora]